MNYLQHVLLVDLKGSSIFKVRKKLKKEKIEEEILRVKNKLLDADYKLLYTTITGMFSSFKISELLKYSGYILLKYQAILSIGLFSLA